MINDLENKTIFITGSSSGIGFGLAKRFLEANNRVIICSKNIKKLKLASKNLDNCFYVQADLTLDKDIKKAIKKIKSKKIIIDVLICNYGNSNYKKNNLDFNHAFENNFFRQLIQLICLCLLLEKKQEKLFVFLLYAELSILKMHQ